MPDLATLAALTFTLVLVSWANARFARLWTKDTITKGFRNRIKQKYGYKSLIFEWSECPWCLGWWSAWPATAIAWFPVLGLRWWWMFPVAVMAVAHATGRLNTVAVLTKDK